MGFADHYFGKQKGFSPAISDLPSEKLQFAVVIPAYCEPGLVGTLQALWNCSRPNGHIEVIVVINSPENSDPSVLESNLHIWQNASAWISAHPDPVMRFFLMDSMNMPVRDAGVGLARKTGMDEALYRFNRINIARGFLLSFDADSQCDENYFTVIEETLEKDKTITGFDVYFEHPVSGNEFQDGVYRGIIEYELHLRYVNQFLRFTGFPYAHHTVGSCFGVRADVYAEQGGMNRRKAGEDFYFLHKIIPLGHFIDITGTRIVPSPRPSGRTPFGTGAAIDRFLSSESECVMTYSPDCFEPLRLLFGQITVFHKRSPGDIESMISALPCPLKDYMQDLHAAEAIAEINANTGSADAYVKRFFRWFDAFRIVKYLNFASRQYYKQIPVREASLAFLEISGRKTADKNTGTLGLLHLFREIERHS